MKRVVTINDVAREAGCSTATVSRILNDKPDVSASTRERVLEVVKRLGYTPHIQAQRLAAGRSRTIALLFPLGHEESTQLDLRFVVGAARAASERGFYFNFVHVDTDEEDLLRLYHGAQIDGAILMQVTMDDPRIRVLREHHLEFVLIGRPANVEGLSYTDFNFEEAVFQSFRYLVRRGRSTIGFITRPAEMRERQLGSAMRLLEGYKRSRAAFFFNTALRETELDSTQTAAATRSLVDELPDLDAIVATHGRSTVGIIRTLESLGRRVPQDVNVISIATKSVAEMTTPPLTSVHFPSEEMGYEAARMLIDRIAGGDGRTPRHVLFDPKLVLRGTTSD